VKVRMADPPASIPAHWMLCRTARQFRASVATFGDAVQDSPRTSDGVEFLPVKRIVERPDGTAAEGEWYAHRIPWVLFLFLSPSLSMLGELTDIGRQVVAILTLGELATYSAI
jgi:acid phosphatase